MSSFDKPCGKLSFEEFQSKVMESVRKQNHISSIDSFERHIIFKEFHQGTSNAANESLFATVYYADEICTNECSITMYDFMCHHIHGDRYAFCCDDNRLYNEHIQAITRMSNCLSRNKGKSFGYALDDYQKRYGEKTLTKAKEL